MLTEKPMKRKAWLEQEGRGQWKAERGWLIIDNNNRRWRKKGAILVRLALFVTCLVDGFFPRVGEAVARLLRREGLKIEFPREQTCCGQFAYNNGFQAEARGMARHFLQVFRDFDYVVTPSGSCAAMVRVYYPELFPEGTDLHREALGVGDRTYDFSEFMVEVLGRRDIGASWYGRAAYHRSCHMQRELGVTSAPLELLRHVRGLQCEEMPRSDLCCGFGGGFSVRMPELSVAMADEKLQSLGPVDLLVGSDTGCLMHLGGRLAFAGRAVKVVHLAELLAVGCGLMTPEPSPVGVRL